MKTRDLPNAKALLPHGRLVNDVDAVDAGPPRALTAPSDDLVDTGRGAFEHDLDPTVGEVAHRAGDPGGLRLVTA